MKNTIDNSGAQSKELAELGEFYKSELGVVCENQGAEKSDLEHLIGYIQAKSAPRRLVGNILKQACHRLCQLRECHLALAAFEGISPKTGSSITQFGEALDSGASFSLQEAGRALKNALIHNGQLDDNPQFIADILAAQALNSAIMQELRHSAQLYNEAAGLEGLALSIQWQYQIQRALVLIELGRDYRDIEALEQAVELLETTVGELAPKEQRSDDWIETQRHLGDALGILGQRHRGTHLLEYSIETYENVLKQFDHERLGQQWATLQNNLGNALGALGQRKGNTELLENSVAAFKFALEERTQEKTPDDWATTLNNLGAALQSLGEREEGTRRLSESVAAYTKVLKVWTRQRRPMEWAATLNNLGTVLRSLGERQSGSRSLEKSVAAYQNALQVRNREEMPQDWAMTQNNLGAALQTLAQRDDDTKLLEQAVTAYENTLQVWTRQDLPMRWTMTMANLGVARRALAERAKDINIARLAVTEINEVAEFFRDASHAQYRELSEEQLTKARELVEELGG